MLRKHHPILALLGYSLLVIVSIVFLVIIVEYDHDGAIVKQPEHYLEGSVTLINGTPHLITEDGEQWTLRRTEGRSYEEGQLVFAYRMPETQDAIPESALPHKPRGPLSVIVGACIMLACMVLVAGDPSVAFYDLCDPHHA